ncbi:MAG TPA: glucose 1-dehydrogenase [Syntrophales bacterium]|nr:glucose 1-dehydrogenase [Syntrophales bacterium]HOL59507.1 glucose 1-dehydrogenase [Syntrophales bacterium]HPO35597.1 glucose 1-dehydrogenase [Syntrophales bacterium]
MRLKGKVALVTGASKGIGKAIAIGYAKEGAKVVVASRSLNLLQGIEREIRAQGGEAWATFVDVRDLKSIEKVVQEATQKFGRLDIMVNNAGISMAHPSETLSPEDWKNAIETDLYGVFYGCQCAAKIMIPQGGGSIINISSVYGIVAAPARAAYCASKAAVNMLTQVLAIEWAKKNIRVNAIAPGYVRTELVQGVIEKGMLPMGAVEKRTPLGRIGEPEEMVGLAVYLASDESSFMTGSIINIDGGWAAYGYL